MLDDEQLHWDEGLFVRPQHFQTMQRQAIGRHAADRRLLGSFPYGLVEVEPDIAAARLRFDRLHVILRDGTVVHHGRNAVVRPVELTGAARTTIHLAVRRDAAGFRQVTHLDVPDENTGGDAAAVTGRLIDAHLFAGAVPDPGVWESLPVLRLAGGRVDEAFAPACFHLAAWPPLRRLVVDVVDRARAARDAAAAAISAGSPDSLSRADVQLFARHRALSHFAATIGHDLRDPALTPFAAYGSCLRLLAAVRAADAGDPVESEFDHDDPWPAFADLHARVVAATAVAVDPPRQYDLRPLDPPLPADLLGCHPDVELLLAGTHAAVLAVAADRSEDADAAQQVLALRNLKVAAPGALAAFQAGLLLPWQLMEAGGEELPPLHAGPGLTRFVRLTVQPDIPAWQRVRAERTLAVRYPTVTAGGRRELRLRFRLFLVPIVAASTVR